MRNIKLSKKTKKIVKKLKKALEEDRFYTRTIGFFAREKTAFLKPIFNGVKKNATNLSVLMLVVIVSGYVLYPAAANADIESNDALFDLPTIDILIDAMQNDSDPYGRLPLAKDAQPRSVYTIPVTAYTSEVAQTDDTPCITASGLDVCERNIENVVAANFLPIGTRVRIPDYYGDRVFYVEDRMNKRYDKRMDIWMKKKSDAKQWGIRRVTVEVF